jgi:signal recognition particle subunit SRP54
MVLEELGNHLSAALRRLNTSTIVDDDVVKEILNDITRSLMGADVSFKIVGTLIKTIKSRLNLEDEAAGTNKRKLVQRVVMEELVGYHIFYFYQFDYFIKNK